MVDELVKRLNLPCDEKLVREILIALPWQYKPDIDRHTIPLERVFADPNSFSIVPRIYSVTEGPGIHRAESRLCGRRRVARDYQVPADEVYATIDDCFPLYDGYCITYKFKRQESGSLKVMPLDKWDVHENSG